MVNAFLQAFLLNMRLFAELDVMAGVPDVELPPLSEAVDSLIAAAQKEAAEAAELRAKGMEAKPVECPFANLGKYLENCDFRWLLKLHESEGEKERFEADVEREKAKRLKQQQGEAEALEAGPAAGTAGATSAPAAETKPTAATEGGQQECPMRAISSKHACVAAALALLAWAFVSVLSAPGSGVSAHE